MVKEMKAVLTTNDFIVYSDDWYENFIINKKDTSDKPKMLLIHLEYKFPLTIEKNLFGLSKSELDIIERIVNIKF